MESSVLELQFFCKHDCKIAVFDLFVSNSTHD